MYRAFSRNIQILGFCLLTYGAKLNVRQNGFSHILYVMLHYYSTSKICLVTMCVATLSINWEFCKLLAVLYRSVHIAIAMLHIASKLLSIENQVITYTPYVTTQFSIALLSFVCGVCDNTPQLFRRQCGPDIRTFNFTLYAYSYRINISVFAKKLSGLLCRWCAVYNNYFCG